MCLHGLAAWAWYLPCIIAQTAFAALFCAKEFMTGNRFSLLSFHVFSLAARRRSIKRFYASGLKEEEKIKPLERAVLFLQL